MNINDTATNCTNSATDSVVITNINNCSVLLQNTNYGTTNTLSTIVTSGTGPYQYQWSCNTDSTFSSTSPDPVVNIPYNTPTTYCVTVTDTTGCVATACSTIVDSQVVYSPCQIYIVVYPDPNVPGSYYSVIYTSGAGNLTYLWDFGDGTTSNLEFPSHTYATPGYYVVCLTVSDGAGCNFSFCDSAFYAYKYGGGPMQQFSVSGQVTLGVSNIKPNTLGVYPNPATNEISIATSGQKVDKATVYNLEGQMVSSIEAPAQNKINVSALPEGVYFIEVKIGNNLARVKFAKLNK